VWNTRTFTLSSHTANNVSWKPVSEMERAARYTQHDFFLICFPRKAHADMTFPNTPRQQMRGIVYIRRLHKAS
jgi:hypothetical protein